MKFTAALTVLLSTAATLALAAKEPPKQLQIGVKHRPASCPIKSQRGDKLAMHYTGKLWNGEKFDSSLDRGQPFVSAHGVSQCGVASY